MRVSKLPTRSWAGALLLGSAALVGCGDEVGTVQLAIAELDTGPTARGAVTSFFPASFQLAVQEAVLFGDGDEQAVYQADEGTFLEFVRADGQPVLTANQQVLAGTYDRMDVSVGTSDMRAVVVAGCAPLAGELHCTRSEPSASSVHDSAEPIVTAGANTISPVLPTPVTVSADAQVELNLYFDLTGAVTFVADGYDDNGAVRFGDGAGIQVNYPPLFAFIGQPPPVEIYELRLTNDPEPTVDPKLEESFSPLDRWRARMWMFFDDVGDPLARRDVWISDEGADGRAWVSMFSQAAVMSRNADGSYAIVEPNPDTDFPYWRLDAFQRESHDGTATYTTPQGSKEVGYAVSRLK